jgi:hypothetical protein
MPEDFEGLKTLGVLLMKIVAGLVITVLVLAGLLALTCGGIIMFSS